MEPQKGLLLRVLINRAHGSVTEPLLRPLPADVAKGLLENQISATDPEPLLRAHERAILYVHYSWIHSYLSNLSPADRRPLIACLSEPQRIGVSRLFKEEPPAALSSPLLRKFYLTRLYPLIASKDLLPIDYLPETPQKELLKLSKKQLLELIDLMGMYDLAHEMRQIVDTKNLKNLYTCLSAKQQQFLRACMHQKDKVVSPKLHLEHWDGECKKLMNVVHQRGLARLALAISGQDPNLVWYLTHILDIGRGNLLLRLTKKTEVPQLSSAVMNQVQSALNYLT